MPRVELHRTGDGILPHAHGKLVVSRAGNLALRMDAHDARSRAVLLLGEHVVDAEVGQCTQGDFPVDPRDHEAGPPIPAAVALDLADQVAMRGLNGVDDVRDRVGQLRRARRRSPLT